MTSFELLRIWFIYLFILTFIEENLVNIDFEVNDHNFTCENFLSFVLSSDPHLIQVAYMSFKESDQHSSCFIFIYRGLAQALQWCKKKHIHS